MPFSVATHEMFRRRPTRLFQHLDDLSRGLLTYHHNSLAARDYSTVGTKIEPVSAARRRLNGEKPRLPTRRAGGSTTTRRTENISAWRKPHPTRSPRTRRACVCSEL